jgi:hypothetical protein
MTPRGGVDRLGRAVCRELCRGICLVGVLLVFVVPGATQAGFRITYDVQSRDAKATVLEGRVFNDTGVDVLDVWVTARALSATGKVLGRGIVFVGSSISNGGSAPFEVKVPAAEGVETFRMAVSSYRAGSAVQSP